MSVYIVYMYMYIYVCIDITLHIILYILVGGFNHLEKYESVEVIIIPNIWKKVKHVPNHQPDLYGQWINIHYV